MCRRWRWRSAPRCTRESARWCWRTSAGSGLNKGKKDKFSNLGCFSLYFMVTRTYIILYYFSKYYLLNKVTKKNSQLGGKCPLQTLLALCNYRPSSFILFAKILWAKKKVRVVKLVVAISDTGSHEIILQVITSQSAVTLRKVQSSNLHYLMINYSCEPKVTKTCHPVKDQFCQEVPVPKCRTVQAGRLFFKDFLFFLKLFSNLSKNCQPSHGFRTTTVIKWR